MAKRCQHCKREYPDHELACPHCGVEADGADAFAEVWLEEEAGSKAPAKAPEEDSAVRLDVVEEATVAPSDQALGDWLEEDAAAPADAGAEDLVAVVEEEQAATLPTEPVEEVFDVGAEDVVEVVPEAEAERPQPVGEEQAAQIFGEEPIEAGTSPSDLLIVSEAASVESGPATPPPADAAAVAGSKEFAVGPAPAGEQREVPPTQLAARAAQPTQLAARAAQPTQLAAQQPMPTMLAPQDHGEREPPPSGLAGDAAGVSRFPDLTLDSGKLPKPGAEEIVIGPEDAADVIDVTEPAEVADATEALDVVDVGAAAPAEDAGALDVLGADEATEAVDLSGKDLVAEEVVGGEAEDALGEEALVESASAVDLGGPLSDRPGPVSGLDPIAEALESGDNLDPESSAPALVTDEESALEPAVDESEESSAVDLGATAPMTIDEGGLDEAASSKEAGVDLEATQAFEEPAEAVEPEEAGEVEEVAADELLAEDAEEAAAADLLTDAEPAEAAEAEEAAEVEEAAEPAEEAEEAAEAAEEPFPVTGSRKGRTGRRAPALDEEEGGRYRKPRYGRRWLAGTLVGILLAAGGVAGVRYFAPEVLDDTLDKIPTANPRPKQVVQSGTKAPTATPVQQALVFLHQGDVNKAWNLVKDTGNSPEELSARGEVRWLKYLHDLKNAAPQANAPEVKTALKELRDAKNDLLAAQIGITLGQGQKATELGKSEQAVRDLLVKAKLVPAAGPADLPAVVGQLLTAKAQEDQRMAAIAKALVDAKILDNPDKLEAKTIAALAQDLGEAKAVVGSVEKLIGAKKEQVSKKLQELITARKDLDEKLTQVNDALKKAKAKDGGAEGIVELAKSRDQLQAEKTSLNNALVQALKELGQPAAPKAGGDLTKELMASIAAVRDKARSPVVTALSQVVSSLGDLSAGANGMIQAALNRATVEGELRYYQAREPLIQAPAQKIDTWIALFQSGEAKDARDAQAAARDAAWVTSKEAKSSPEATARAHFLEGLLARNQAKYAEARKKLADAVKEGQSLKTKPEWPTQAARLLKELTDPTAYYLPRAESLAQEGRGQAALAVLNTGLAAIPDNSRLRAQRALVTVETAGAPARLKEVEKQVRADAEAAAKDPATAATATYALGRLEEELGHFAKAEADYHQALKASKDNPAEANRIRVALARLLLREPSPAAEAAPAAPPAKGAAAEAGAAGEESEEADDEAAVQVPANPALAALVVAALTGAQAPDVDDEEDPAMAARLKESIDLAQDLIKSPDPKTKGQGLLLLGLAHSRQGKRTEGLNEYLKGLSLLHPGRATEDLMKLVAEHPAFQQPDLRAQPSAITAESYFGKGLALYWSQQYPQAEAELKKAVEFYGQDARYRYFLGLARLAQDTKQKRREGRFDLEVGARLEAENHPSSRVVNAALERIQGPLRDYLDGYRQKALVAAR
jgi:hypothetical protein